MTLHDSMLPLLLVSSAFRCQDAFSFRRELRLLEIVRPAQAAEHRFGGQAQCPGKVTCAIVYLCSSRSFAIPSYFKTLDGNRQSVLETSMLKISKK